MSSNTHHRKERPARRTRGPADQGFFPRCGGTVDPSLVYALDGVHALSRSKHGKRLRREFKELGLTPVFDPRPDGRPGKVVKLGMADLWPDRIHLGVAILRRHCECLIRVELSRDSISGTDTEAEFSRLLARLALNDAQGPVTRNPTWNVIYWGVPDADLDAAAYEDTESKFYRGWSAVPHFELRLRGRLLKELGLNEPHGLLRLDERRIAEIWEQLAVWHPDPLDDPAAVYRCFIGSHRPRTFLGTDRHALEGRKLIEEALQEYTKGGVPARAQAVVLASRRWPVRWPVTDFQSHG